MRIKINEKTYQAQEGERILDVCRREGIKIPTLCAFENLLRGAACRLCLVEINLTGKLVTSCTFPVCDKLEVITESDRITKARNINMELLWADHAGKCVTCKKNLQCELQSLAADYKIENFHFVPRKGEITDQEERKLLRDNKSRVVVDDKNPVIHRTTEFCVECRRCIGVCPEKKFGFNNRARDVVVGTPYNKTLGCSFCGECVRVCPTAALTDKNDMKKIGEDLSNIKKMAVAIIDLGMEEKILEQFKKMGKEENIRELFQALGFEKIINVTEKDSEDETIRNVKTDYAKKEKINPEDIVVFFISDKIRKKAEKSEYLDYVLTEREIPRLKSLNH